MTTDTPTYPRRLKLLSAKKRKTPEAFLADLVATYPNDEKRAAAIGETAITVGRWRRKYLGKRQ